MKNTGTDRRSSARRSRRALAAAAVMLGLLGAAGSATAASAAPAAPGRGDGTSTTARVRPYSDNASLQGIRW